MSEIIMVGLDLAKNVFQVHGADSVGGDVLRKKPWKPDTAQAVARNEILRTSNRVGRTIWRRWSCQPKRIMLRSIVQSAR
jgi:hypothetical protein